MGPELLRNEAVKVGIFSEILTLVRFHLNRFQSGKNVWNFGGGKTRREIMKEIIVGRKSLFTILAETRLVMFSFLPEELRQNVFAGYYSGAQVVAKKTSLNSTAKSRLNTIHHFYSDAHCIKQEIS